MFVVLFFFLLCLSSENECENAENDKATGLNLKCNLRGRCTQKNKCRCCQSTRNREIGRCEEYLRRVHEAGFWTTDSHDDMPCGRLYYYWSVEWGYLYEDGVECDSNTPAVPDYINETIAVLSENGYTGRIERQNCTVCTVENPCDVFGRDPPTSGIIVQFATDLSTYYDKNCSATGHIPNRYEDCEANWDHGRIAYKALYMNIMEGKNIDNHVEALNLKLEARNVKVTRAYATRGYLESYLAQVSLAPSPKPTYDPTPSPTPSPTQTPTYNPSPSPTQSPTYNPSPSPTQLPINDPTPSPTQSPTKPPTYNPSPSPTQPPTYDPTTSPTQPPTYDPTPSPTQPPTYNPTLYPTQPPTYDPTSSPTQSPTNHPTLTPTQPPTYDPTTSPTQPPTYVPTLYPTQPPTYDPTPSPTQLPTNDPTLYPTQPPTYAPTLYPTTQPPTGTPTPKPTKRSRRDTWVEKCVKYSNDEGALRFIGGGSSCRANIKKSWTGGQTCNSPYIICLPQENTPSFNIDGSRYYNDTHRYSVVECKEECSNDQRCMGLEFVADPNSVLGNCTLLDSIPVAVENENFNIGYSGNEINLDYSQKGVEALCFAKGGDDYCNPYFEAKDLNNVMLDCYCPNDRKGSYTKRVKRTVDTTRYCYNDPSVDERIKKAQANRMFHLCENWCLFETSDPEQGSWFWDPWKQCYRETYSVGNDGYCERVIRKPNSIEFKFIHFRTQNFCAA